MPLCLLLLLLSDHGLLRAMRISPLLGAQVLECSAVTRDIHCDTTQGRHCPIMFVVVARAGGGCDLTGDWAGSLGGAPVRVA